MDLMRRRRPRAPHRPGGEHLRRDAPARPRGLARSCSARTSTRCPNGGNFDGALGSLAAIEVVRAIAAAGVTTRHPVEVVVWAHEEGGTFRQRPGRHRAPSSANWCAGEMDQVWNGLRRADAIRRIGGDPDRIDEARRAPGSTPTSSCTSSRAAPSTASACRSASSRASSPSRPFRGGDRRRRESRRHDADGRSPGRAGRGFASWCWPFARR